MRVGRFKEKAAYLLLKDRSLGYPYSLEADIFAYAYTEG